MLSFNIELTLLAQNASYGILWCNCIDNAKKDPEITILITTCGT